MAAQFGTGSIKKSGAKFGFILQDNGEPDLFVMPGSCGAFGGRVPEVGTRVEYTLGIDRQKGSPLAENVQPDTGGAGGGLFEEGGLGNLEIEMARIGAKATGVMKENRGNLGFIAQDNGEKDMFVLPGQCEAFGKALPPLGTPLLFDVGTDPKTGRPTAENVEPAEPSFNQVDTRNGLLGDGRKGQGKGSSQPHPQAIVEHPSRKRSFEAAAGPGVYARVAQASPLSSGTMKVSKGNCGYIEQDSGEGDIFVLPLQCYDFGNVLPEVGTRVSYTVGVDKKKGLPIAEQVHPFVEPAVNRPSWAKGGGPSSAAGPATSSGVIKVNKGTSGFIAQDSGEGDIFVLPFQCPDFGNVLPVVGTRVSYTVGVDPKKGLPVAEQVHPFVEPAVNRPSWAKGGGPNSAAGLATSSGVIKENRGKLGFIAQDSGDKDMFLMPGQCAAFGGEIPPVGTPVMYDITIDEKTQRPRADNVQPQQQVRGAGPPVKKQRILVPPLPNQERQASYVAAAPAPLLYGKARDTYAPVPVPKQLPRGQFSGTLKSHNGRSAFIQQDSSETDMFVLPGQCGGFAGQLPAAGTRVVYTVGMDKKKGLPIAENVDPEPHGQVGEADMLPEPLGDVLTGTVKRSNEKSGFILQDSGEADMFFMPSQCQGGRCPPEGSRVAYSVEIDPKSGRPRAAEVFPEEECLALLGVASGNGVSSDRATGTVKGSQGGNNWAFIDQDNDENDLFVMPSQCQAFGGVIPPGGTRVVYGFGTDPKNGRPLAQDVCPLPL